MSIITITPKDLQSAGLNILYGAAHKIIGGAAAYLVIKTADFFYARYYSNNTRQKVERAAILASCVVSYYAASQTPLKTFSFRKAVELFVLELILNAGCKRWCFQQIEVFIPSIYGTLGGNLGGAWLGYLSDRLGQRTGPMLMSIMGAQSYVSIYRENCDSQRKLEPVHRRFLTDGK